ncbi:MAG: hypothetical protein QOJ54_599 [Aliidongia sp.]|nr:hypothetical protein [Aliidongia sp.]
MSRILTAALLAGVTLTVCSSALAHAVVGARIFPATLTIDDPAVSDEASLPTFTWQPQGPGGGTPGSQTFGYGWEYDKRITQDFGFAINDGYTVIKPDGAKSLYGWQDVSITLKYQAYLDATHEFIVSLGIIKEFGGTGAARIGADTAGVTVPTVYFGKGAGDLPTSLDYLRPFAVTGTFGYQFADERRQTMPGLDPVTGLPALLTATNPNQLVIGASIQYSLPYLQSQVRDLGLGPVLGRVVPLVEFAYSTPATASFGNQTQGTIAPGFIYIGSGIQIGLEALIPATRFTGNRVGLLAQFHLFLDDVLPTTLGKPIF